MLGQHYLGIIHGATEEEMNKLRKFVNQIIFEPIDKFTPEIVRAIMAQKIIEKSEEKTESGNEKQKKDTNNVIDYQAFKRPQIKGKSKL